MKCAYCQKPVRWWQSKTPLGGGLLPNSFGQFEHSDCQLKRFKSISASHATFQACINAVAATALLTEAPTAPELPQEGGGDG